MLLGYLSLLASFGTFVLVSLLREATVPYFFHDIGYFFCSTIYALFQDYR